MKNVYIILIGTIAISACNNYEPEPIHVGPPPVIDAEGNSYKTVEIGDQMWMAENLRVTIYNDSTPINKIENKSAWISDTAGAYCYSQNDVSNKSTYGALYNYYTVESDKLCPTGWHIPTPSEWNELESYIGSNVLDKNKEGKAIKSTLGWSSGNGSDKFGFNARPSGARSYLTGDFDNLSNYGHWWSDSLMSSNHAFRAFVGHDITTIEQSFTDRSNGFSVRCIKDSIE